MRPGSTSRLPVGFPLLFLIELFLLPVVPPDRCPCIQNFSPLVTRSRRVLATRYLRGSPHSLLRWAQLPSVFFCLFGTLAYNPIPHQPFCIREWAYPLCSSEILRAPLADCCFPPFRSSLPSLAPVTRSHRTTTSPPFGPLLPPLPPFSPASPPFADPRHHRRAGACCTLPFNCIRRTLFPADRAGSLV